VMAQDVEFDAKVERALELGEQYLDVENAQLSEIHPDSDYWRAVASTDPPDGAFPTGTALNLQMTYCRQVVAEGDSVAIHDAEAQGWDDDPAFQATGVRCYHGSPITLDGEHYGTLCFVSKTPRSEPFSEGETLFAELIARLIEHELKRQRTETRIERLEQFAGVLAHDLRNPLSVVHGRIELARDTGDIEHLSPAETALDRMETLISDTLTMAQQSRNVENTERVRLKTLCEQCWAAVDTAGAELIVTGAITIRAAPDRLRHLFENLFRNAVEHGGPEVTVRVGALSDGQGFYVEDTGPGIPEDDRDSVFERGQTSGDKGLGLGLAIVEGVVAAHDWHIALTEGSDGGARFEIRDVAVVDSVLTDITADPSEE